MLTRNLRIALLLSIGLHIIGMSVVGIVTPQDMWPKRQYTKVDFLGPILRKTAFDIMLESASPVLNTTYRSYSMAKIGDKYLKTTAPKVEGKVPLVPQNVNKSSSGEVEGFLAGEKQVPETILDTKEEAYVFNKEPDPGKKDRKVVFKPQAPVITQGQYGDKEFYILKVRVLIDTAGNVLRVEPLTTSGFPQLDLDAAKYVKAWIFEPDRSLSAKDAWQETDVILYTVKAQSTL